MPHIPEPLWLECYVLELPFDTGLPNNYGGLTLPDEHRLPRHARARTQPPRSLLPRADPRHVCFRAPASAEPSFAELVPHHQE
jgi:hypothetical protein